jgi:serine phosphatase RsbU (regulator of sigma subunit)
VSETKNSTIVAIADCTGHGVPGGFMSTLGIAFLNEMAAKKDFSKPNIILNNLRNAVVHALRQQSIAGTVRDGMDIAILQIMKKSTMIHFAGANMPVYIVRKKANALNLNKHTVENEDYYLQEIKGDNMPVSIHDKMEDFQLKTIDTQNICDIYFTSDGYADQFGGKHHRKFNKKRFKKLLLDVSGKESNTQYNVIKNKFEEWKGHIQQTDDVLVFGLKPK